MTSRFLLALAVVPAFAAPPEPKFRAITLDSAIQIGYGVAVADVDGDKAPDVLLADKKQFVWYRNPGATKAGAAAAWQKFVLAENLTEKDNVCIAAQDLDGDGKCEIAVGAEWNPSDTEKSGAVFYLIPPADRTQRWEGVKFPSVEPTTHRMKWVKLDNAATKTTASADTAKKKVSPSASSSTPAPVQGDWGLVVVPLHGRGNKNGEGAPVKVLCYRKPADVRSEWAAEVVDESMHATHNFERLIFPDEPGREHLLLGGKEGLVFAMREEGRWKPKRCVEHGGYAPPLGGVGEVRIGWRTENGERKPFGAAIEPMHGSALVYYQQGADPQSKMPPRTVLTDQLADGHALACGDVLGTKSDQIVVGWRGNPQKPRPVGIKLFTPLDGAASAAPADTAPAQRTTQWRESFIDDNEMACEDLVLADLNGDGRLDVVASGRSTHNVKIYLNETQ